MARAPRRTTPNPSRRKLAIAPGAPADAVAPIWAQGGDVLTTANGLSVGDTDNSLRAGERGPVAKVLIEAIGWHRHWDRPTVHPGSKV
jgi:hypothetical protein